MVCRQLLVKAQREAARLQETPCTLPGPSFNQPEGRLLMVEYPTDLHFAAETVLRSLNELQDGGDAICKTIPYRCACSYTFLKGE